MYEISVNFNAIDKTVFGNEKESETLYIKQAPENTISGACFM